MTFDTPQQFLATPDPSGQDRLDAAKIVRRIAMDTNHPAVTTTTNGEETDHQPEWPVQFTKGLPHDENGIVDATAYCEFVTAINQASLTAMGQFLVPTGDSIGYATASAAGAHKFRAWESPRAGHAFDLSAPDGDQVGMDSPPRLGSSEATAEMAEIYGLALLRDVDFKKITDASTDPGPAGTSPAEVIAMLNSLPYFNGTATDLDGQAMRRQAARFEDSTSSLTGHSVFRGSGEGAKTGPYLSQFLLVGSKGHESMGQIDYGGQTISQRVNILAPQQNFMGDWRSWLDIQNGADPRELQKASGTKRYLSTPRDLASYVRVDQLYQAYLNAAFILTSHGMPFDPHLPTGGHTTTRDSFATFGGPDLLAVLTKVSSAALKAVRRQKFNYHRRCRPERIGGVLTLADSPRASALGAAQAAASSTLTALKDIGLLSRISALNLSDLADTANPLTNRGMPDWIAQSYLLPMAFVEGSPMHPSYGAGHATVAGACVTVLKAFLDMFNDPDDWSDRTLPCIGMNGVFEAVSDQKELQPVSGCQTLTINGELNKLAANIAIGRNMAGVHFYTDYYDSLRMGERVAVGMLRERMMSYQEPFSMRFKSFDGDQVRLVSQWNRGGHIDANVEINGSLGAFSGWWKRHVPDQTV